MRDTLKIGFLWLTLFSLLTLTACGSATDETPEPDADGDQIADGDVLPDGDTAEPDADGDVLPEGDAESEPGIVRVHVWADFQAYLYYSLDGAQSWVVYPGLKMGDEGTGWWSSGPVSLAQNPELHFVVNDGAEDQSEARWLKPKGEENDPDAHFIVTNGEVWVKEGVVYAANPDVDGDEAETEIADETEATEDGDETIEDGDAVESDATDNDTADNDTTDNDTADNDTVDNDTTDNDTTDNDTADNDTADNDTADNDTADNDTTDNDTNDPDENLDTDSESESEPPTTRYILHLDTGWTTPSLHYRNTADSTFFDAALSHEEILTPDTDWYVVTIDLPEGASLEYLFNNGSPQSGADWVHPCGQTDGNFTATPQAAELWIRGGVAYTHKPVYKTITAHYNSGWSAVQLHYSRNTLDCGWISSQLTSENSGSWWTATLALDDTTQALIFMLKNGSGSEDHPPGGGNYNTSLSEFWLKDGQITATRPSR